mmetsp:Transcript_4208/g.7389  ORF Transcript_4208/g.7389 Transcript_4208/m.7389 type:complete len:156 (-) Transcript_4208:60-527(-)
MTESVSIMKVRKPYELTKNREFWSDEEHENFLVALSLFGRDWKSIQRKVSTKSTIQIRSHAQKYFNKLEKTAPHLLKTIPPPRSRRNRIAQEAQKLNRDSLISTKSSTTTTTSSYSNESVIHTSTGFDLLLTAVAHVEGLSEIVSCSEGTGEEEY